MGTKIGLVLFLSSAFCVASALVQTAGHCQQYQTCIYETRQHFIACLGGIGTTILLDYANNLEAHRLLAHHDNWKTTCIQESSSVTEIALTQRAAQRHQSMMECFGKPFIITNTNMTEEKHLTCTGIQTELSGFSSVFQTAAEPNECSMIYRRVLKRCDILADCCPQFDECVKRNHNQYHDHYFGEKEMATKLLDCLKEGPKFARDLPAHVDRGEKADVSFKDLPPEVQNELIQNTFDRRKAPQSDAAPPAPIVVAPPAPPALPSPPGPPSTPAASSEPVTEPSTASSSSEATSQPDAPVPPPSTPAKAHAAPTANEDPLNAFMREKTLFTRDPVKTDSESSKADSIAAPLPPAPEITPAPAVPALPTLATLPPIPTLPPPEKAWSDLVKLLFPTLATTTELTPATEKAEKVLEDADPLTAVVRKHEKAALDHKMEFLNRFYCSEYMRCQDEVQAEYEKCEKNFAGEYTQYGIINTQLREELLAHSVSQIRGVKTACFGFISAQTVEHFAYLQAEANLADNQCVENSTAIVLPMAIIEKCDATLHYKPAKSNETEELSKNLTECLTRVKLEETRCSKILDCCPQHTACVAQTPTGLKEQLKMLEKQILIEQATCETTMSETIERHQARLDRFKYRYLNT
ncbi:hypothetical protein L596_000072 [Steinernema carpocapsae]|uniref:Chondroitin proteoglycan 4 domain-containing protein n=1 Tax=Steinernema carpocapsae TaxID=34508 RepID=A0A4U8UJ52_STECR|nr:hypothetical protein L596_000072 [Steinernema carpocapsae]